MDKNTIVWADIPVTDMTRARRFYSEMLQAEPTDMPGTEGSVVVLPGGPIGADLYMGKPSAEGTTVYLDGEPDAGVILGRVEAAGGKILQPKTNMGEMVGYIGFFLDSEGNRLGVRSRG